MNHDPRTTRILVVEDSPTQALELQFALAAAGFHVEIARDGQEGLETLTTSPLHFDVVLSDIVMPNISGYELCRAIKADPTRKHIPFLLLTKLNDPQDVILGLECGADNFIRKPFEADYLIGRINAVLAVARRETPAVEDESGVEVGLMEKTFTITSGKEQILHFLASTFEDFVRSERRVQESRRASEQQEREAEAARAREEIVRAEKEAFQASEERFRSFMDNSHTVAFMKDEDGRLVYVNAPFLKCFGGTLADWLGKTDFELWPEPIAMALRANDSSVLAGGETVELLENVPTATGGTRQWSTFKFPFRDAHGRLFLGGVAADVTEKRRAEQEIRTLNVRLERRLERLNALRRIDQAITASLDLCVTLNTVLDQVMAQLGTHAAALLLLDPASGVLEHAAGRGFRGTGITRTRLRVGAGCAGRVALERRLVTIADIAEEGPGFLRSAALEEEAFVAYIGVPLVAKGQVKGVLEVFHRDRLDPDPEWIDFLEALAGQAAIAVENGTLFDDLQRSNTELTVAYDATIEGWARALDLRDKETEGHSRRVTEMAVRLARALGLDRAAQGHIRRGAMLHDVGKLGIPDAVLLKTGPLSDDEWRVMRLHPEHAHEWLAPIAYLRTAIEIPYCHHEQWDGSGYPRGLKGEQIPLAARIFAVVDVWDALRSDRPYRKAWPEEKVREHLRSLVGAQLDPAVVEVFLRLLETEGEDFSLPSTGRGMGRVSTLGVEAMPDAERTALEGRLAEQHRLASELNQRFEAQGQELARAQARIAALNAPDELTGLMSRRHFRDALEAAFSFAIRQGQSLTVVLLDVDHLQSYNDAFGRSAGDGVLCAVARAIREHSRPYDVAARQGGDEFAVLLPATDARVGREVAERLHAAVAGHGWPLRPMTVSVGAATLSAATLTSIELVEEAELALLNARQLGRDRVTHFDEGTIGKDNWRTIGVNSF